MPQRFEPSVGCAPSGKTAHVGRRPHVPHPSEVEEAKLVDVPADHQREGARGEELL